MNTFLGIPFNQVQNSSNAKLLGESMKSCVSLMIAQFAQDRSKTILLCLQISMSFHL